MYKSSSKRKSHILKNHPGQKPPPSARDKAALAAAAQDKQQVPLDQQNKFNPTFSTTVGSVTSQPHNCSHCHKQYATNAKLLQHLRKDHQRLETDPLGQLEQWRPMEAAAEHPSNLEYRLDGEVMQLTRVPQAEAMRLVNNGATVIHVENGGEAAAGPSTSNRQTQSTNNQNFDLPPELVQVLQAANPPPPPQRAQSGQDPDQWINAYRRHQ